MKYIPWIKLLLASISISFVVLFGALKLTLPREAWWAPPVHLYCKVSGACTGYGYFAPGIGADARAKITVFFADQRVETIIFGRGGSEESKTKRGLLSFYFLTFFKEPQLRRSIASSWARRSFYTYPDATKILINVDALELPSMEEFRIGKRGTWIEIYSGEFNQSSF